VKHCDAAAEMMRCHRPAGHGLLHWDGTYNDGLGYWWVRTPASFGEMLVGALGYTGSSYSLFVDTLLPLPAHDSMLGKGVGDDANPATWEESAG